MTNTPNCPHAQLPSSQHNSNVNVAPTLTKLIGVEIKNIQEHLLNEIHKSSHCAKSIWTGSGRAEFIKRNRSRSPLT